MKQIDKILDKVTYNDDMDIRYTYYDPYVGEYGVTVEKCECKFPRNIKTAVRYGDYICKLGILEDLLDVLGIDFCELFTILPKYAQDCLNDSEVIK